MATCDHSTVPGAATSPSTVITPPPVAEVPGRTMPPGFDIEAMEDVDRDIDQIRHGLDLLRQEMDPDQKNAQLFFLLEALDLLRDRCDGAIQRVWRSVGVTGFSA